MRRQKLDRGEIVDFLDFLETRNLRVGVLLSALFGAECPDDILKSNITKWKNTPAAASVVQDVSYDLCLNRVMKSLEAESVALADDPYFRLVTTQLTEEDILDYNPQVAFEVISKTETMYPLLTAITGTKKSVDATKPDAANSNNTAAN